MEKVSLLYGNGHLDVEISKERLQEVLVSKAHEFRSELSQEEIVKKAMENPIGSAPLYELSKDKNNVVIIASDHTRPVPSKIIMPLMLSEIRKGNPNAHITILIATGCHRNTSKDELVNKFGRYIVENEEIIIHDCDQNDNLVKLGVLPSGGDLIVNKVAVDADLLVAEGFIEPHFFAGFSGGRKSVLPGVASRTTVLANHCAEFIADDNARTGILKDNPIHEDMLYAVKAAKLAYIVNVVIDSDKKVINAFAGDSIEAHLKGTDFVGSLAGVKGEPSDIVITTNGGYPLDQNIYQAVKGMTAAEAICKEGGVIIIAAKCNDGHGGEEFYNTFAKEKNVQDIMDRFLATPRDKTVPDQWQSQIFARVLLKFNVIMVTEAPKEMVENLHMKWAGSIDEAIEMADEILGNNNSKISVIPDGVSVIVLPK